MLPPTKKQLECEKVIARLTRENEGVSPSLDEIGLVLGVTTPAVFHLVRQLVRKGRATRVRGVYRSLQLVQE